VVSALQLPMTQVGFLIDLPWSRGVKSTAETMDVFMRWQTYTDNDFDFGLLSDSRT
jgi:hypothetical protein